MPSRDKTPASDKTPAPAPTVPVNTPSVIVPPPPAAPAPVPAKVDPLPEAVRAFLAVVPRDIAGLPGLTPESYAKYLSARDAVEKALAER